MLAGGLAELEEQLESPDPELRMTAVTKLAKNGEDRAWDLVLSALADADARVADRAQLELAGADARITAELLGHSGLGARNEDTRQRAAELLGRTRVPVEAKRLARGLNDKSSEVRRRVAWSIERLALSGGLEGEAKRHVVPALRRRQRGDKDPLVRGAALVALDAVDHEAALELALDALGDRREGVRCAAAWVVGGDEEGARTHLERIATDPSPRVRSLVVRIQERRGTRDAAEALVALLESEERLRVRWGAVEALRRLSGMRYRLDPRPWRLWVEGLESDWRPARTSGEDPLPDGASRAFGGLPLLSDRVVFLFDLSGSLWTRREDGRTRKEFADAELRRALHALPEDAMFNVIPYTDRPFPWGRRLVKATPRNVARALEFFEGCRESGTGDFLEAALLALEDEDVDSVVVLTDGAPTGGEVWSLDLMVPLLIERNRFRAVRFDSVLVDAPDGLERHWRELAEGTGGRSISIEGR